MTTLGWHPQDIIAAVKKQGLTHKRIAEQLNISRATVSLAIKTGSSPVVREYIAHIIGVPEQELWPYRFPPSDSPR